MKASILVSGDSAGAEAALKATEAALGSAEAEARQLAKAFGDVDVATSRLAAAQTQAKAATDAAKASLAAGEITLDQYNRTLIETKTRVGLVSSAHREAVNGLKGAQAAFNNAMQSAGKAGEANAQMGERTRIAGHHVQNMTFQVNDLIVGLASGQAPMTVFMQQGAQIGQIMAQAGTGVIGMTGSLIAAYPVMSMIAAAAGLVAVGFGVMTAEINKTSAVTVTWQDVALASMQTVKSYLEGELTKGFEAFGLSTNDVWGKTVNATKWALNFMIGAGTFAVRSLIAGFQTLPAALGDAFYSAVNLGIGAIEILVNASIKAIATAIATANPLLAAAGMALLGGKLPSVSFGRVENPFAGGLAKFSGAQFDAMKGSFTTDYLGNMADAVTEQAQANAIERNKEKKKRAGRDAGREAGKAEADEWGKLLLEGLGKFDPQIQERLKGLAAQTESDLFDIRQAADLAFEQTYKGLNKAAEANLEWNENLRGTIAYLSQIGGFGSTLANVGGVMLGLKTGNFDQAGGPLGTVAQVFQQAFPEFSSKIVTGFDDVLKGVFGKNGDFTNMLKGAGAGSAVGSLLFGGNKSAQIGGAIGGSIGQMVGGPVGNLIGSVIGSTLGKLLGGGAKYGTASVVNGKVTTGGNDSDLKGNAGSAAGSIGSALEEIASRLGGSLGGYSVSIGQMDGKWRVSTTGRTGKLENKYKDVTNFGKEGGEQAFAFALSDAISDGAITGISAAVQRALKSDSNIDKALKEAMKVQEVELLSGGINAAIGKALSDFERVAAERVRIAREYGFDVIKIEERNAADRLKLTKQLLAEQVGSLQDLIDEMTSGSLFEGSAVERRQLLLDQVAAAKAAADAGEEGAADRLAQLLQDLNQASRDAFGTTGGFASDRTTILDAARDTIARANQRIADAQAATDSAVVSALDENNDQNAQMLAALGLTNEYLASLASQGWYGSGGLADMARTSAPLA